MTSFSSNECLSLFTFCDVLEIGVPGYLGNCDQECIVLL